MFDRIPYIEVRIRANEHFLVSFIMIKCLISLFLHITGWTRSPSMVMGSWMD